MKDKEIIELAEYRKNEVYAGFRKQCLEANDRYEGRDPIPVPKAFGDEVVHLNTARKIVDTGVFNYMKDNPVTEVLPSGRSQKAEEAARDTQLVYDACLREMRMPIIKPTLKKVLLRGVCFIGLWFDDFYYAINRDELTKEELDEIADRALWAFPLKFTSYDPLNCYPSRAMQTSFQPRDMIVMYDILKPEAVALIENNPAWRWKPKTTEDNVRFIDYYTDDRRVVFLDDKKVYDGENALGFVPFLIVPGGFGQASFEGKVEEEWRPIFYGERELLTSEQVEYTARRRILLNNAYPQVEVIGDADAIKAQFPEGIPTNPDEAVPHTADITLKPMETKGGPDHSWAEGQAMTAAYIDAPREMSGGRTAGVYSARHAEDLITYQRTRYKDAVMNMERALEVYLKMCGRALKVLGNDISVRAEQKGRSVIKSVPASKIDEKCEVRVKLVSESPEARMAKRSQGLAEWQAGAIDRLERDTKFFDMSVDESERMYVGRIIEDFMKQPFMSSIVTAIVAKEKGDLLTAQLALSQFEAERGGANNVVPKRGDEMVPQSGVREEGAPSPQEFRV